MFQTINTMVWYYWLEYNRRPSQTRNNQKKKKKKDIMTIQNRILLNISQKQGESRELHNEQRIFWRH